MVLRDFQPDNHISVIDGVRLSGARLKLFDHNDPGPLLYYRTSSKAFAAMGGFASSSADTIEYLRHYADAYGFSCALPLDEAVGIIEDTLAGGGLD
ncbi:MAG: hypothetical protein R6X02_21180 [Enhygromyxa sp.]